MRIRTRLRLNALFALAAALLAIFPFVWSYRVMARAEQDVHLVREMRRTLMEQQVVRDEYLSNHEERARVQWFTRTERLRTELNRAAKKPASPDEKALHEETARALATADAIFSRIVDDRIKSGAETGNAPPGEERRVAKLKNLSYRLADNLARLEELNGDKADKAGDRTIALLVFFIVMGFIVTAGNSALLNRILSRRLGELREGAEIIGSGNLNHRLAIRGNDEFAELARLTNQMAANLQVSFTSVENLETEIEERKKAEEEREQYFKFFQESSDLMCIADLNGCFTRINPACKQVLGYTEEELLSRPFLDFVHPEDRQNTLDEIAREMKYGFTLSFENRYVCKNGKVRWISWCANYMEEEGLTYGTGRDITERKLEEEELIKLSIAVEQSPVSILITDTKGDIEFVNPRFTQLTGYTVNEVLGKNPRFLKSGGTPPETYRQLWGAITLGNVWQGEFRNRKKNGELFHEYATIAPVKNRQGVITSYIAIKEDVTERRSLEYQLRQSQKMEAIGTLAGGVAHDFNNILTAIIGFGSLLEMKMPKDDPLHHNVTQILAAAERAANLTRSLLAFSRKQQIESRVHNLNDIVSGLEKMLYRLIREDIELTITLAESPLPVLVDAGQVEQILVNLVTNARDAMPDGGTISVSTSATTLDDAFLSVHGYGVPGDYALLVVADNGEGMEEVIRQRVFDPFFTTKEVGKGTGLGLSVCYGIVKQHGGYINCYSELGKGTTFRIYLPVIHEDVAHVEQNATVPLVGGTETILLAEDEPTVRILTTNILKEFGYTVIEACDGEEAVARFSEMGERIDLCLFDVIMPKMKGWEAFEAIRIFSPRARVLFMSGYQADFDQLNDLTKNEAVFISKPVVPRDLLAKVRELLDGK